MEAGNNILTQVASACCVCVVTCVRAPGCEAGSEGITRRRGREEANRHMTNNNNKMNGKSVWLRSSTPRRLPVTPLCLSCLVAAASTRRAESLPQNPRSNCALLPRVFASCTAFPPLSWPVFSTPFPVRPSPVFSLPAIPLFPSPSGSPEPRHCHGKGGSISFSETEPSWQRLLGTCVLCFRPAAKVRKQAGQPPQLSPYSCAAAGGASCEGPDAQPGMAKCPSYGDHKHSDTFLII